MAHTAKEYQEEIDSLVGFRGLVRAYQQIASIRMKKTRDAVVRNREYLAKIEEIFEAVRVSYAKEVAKIAKKSGGQTSNAVTFLAHNGKTVAVLLSANSGLYGSVLQSTYDAFIDEVRKGNVEATIVGAHARNKFVAEEPDRPFTYFELPDEKLKSSNFDELIKHIVHYDEIHLYYGKFVNVVKQVPDIFTISAEISLEDDNKSPHVSYMFEPSLKKILMFFEAQMFGARLEQIARENQLAKYASRVMAMNRADENIESRTKDLILGKLKARHIASNRKQINKLASQSLWGK